MTANDRRPRGDSGAARADATRARRSTDTVPLTPDSWPEDGRVDLVGQPQQLDLDNLLQGVDQAADDPWWRDCADRAVEHLAASGREFDVDDVREQGVPDPASPAAWGAVFATAANAGRITSVGAHRSRRRERRGSLVRVWRGVPRQRPAEDRPHQQENGS